MALLIENLTMLDKLELIEIGIKYFAALTWVKKLRQKTSQRENEIADLFLVMAGCEDVKKISAMAYPKRI